MKAIQTLSLLALCPLSSFVKSIATPPKHITAEKKLYNAGADYVAPIVALCN